MYNKYEKNHNWMNFIKKFMGKTASSSVQMQCQTSNDWSSWKSSLVFFSWHNAFGPINLKNYQFDFIKKIHQSSK